MFDFDTVLQTVVTPVVTFPVIAALCIVLVLSVYDGQRRLNKFAAKSGRTTARLLAAVVMAAEKEMARREAKTIGWTYDALKSIGFDKLATGDVTYEDIIFGTHGRNFAEDLSPTGRRRAWRDRPLEPFSMDDLKSALRPTKDAKVTDGGTVLREDAAGLEGQGPRPYHTADTEARSPRAG
jgi:hypothetical protein